MTNEKDSQDISLKFYSFHDSKKAQEHQSAMDLEKSKSLQYPCLVLVRTNSWNDYSYYTHFDAFYFKYKGDCQYLGVVKIIQYEAPELFTTLPANFEELSDKEFFSRGSLPFYNNLKSLGLKDKVLSALNDIHYKGYTINYISKIGDGSLVLPYTSSLYREDFYDLSVSSEYAKNSLEMIRKIRTCEDSISELDEENKKMVMRLLYGSVIASLESYLGDAFKYHVINNENYFYSFLKNYAFPGGEKKYNLSELGLKGNQIGEFIKDKVKEIMNNIIFHNIRLTRILYKEILNIELPKRLESLQEDIEKRHDIFHRNGKNILGEEVVIKQYDLRRLISDVEKFIADTEHILETKI